MTRTSFIRPLDGCHFPFVILYPTILQQNALRLSSLRPVIHIHQELAAHPIIYVKNTINKWGARMEICGCALNWQTVDFVFQRHQSEMQITELRVYDFIKWMALELKTVCSSALHRTFTKDYKLIFKLIKQFNFNAFEGAVVEIFPFSFCYWNIALRKSVFFSAKTVWYAILTTYMHEFLNWNATRMLEVK